MVTTGQIITRILLTLILSGLVGTEREKLKRPAGIRTHMLVGVGSTLVMLTSLELYETYDNIQVDRMAAQVISGIGFLGAGTIITQGLNVQGLTTAAGLWAVACIGLAIGSGFYVGGVLAAGMVLVTLVLFKNIQTMIMKRDKFLYINITILNKPGQIGKVLETIELMNVSVKKMDFTEEIHKEGDLSTVEMVLKLPTYEMKNEVINKIISQEGVIRVSKETGGKF